MTLLTIVLLAMITFSSRYLFIHPKMPIRLGGKMRQFLSYSAPAVLTAIWVPIIFIQKGELNTGLMNPYLIAASAAIFIAATTKNIYLTLLVSLIIFIGMRFIG